MFAIPNALLTAIEQKNLFTSPKRHDFILNQQWKLTQLMKYFLLIELVALYHNSPTTKDLINRI